MNSALAKAQAAGISAFSFEKRAKGVIAYRALATEISERLNLTAESNARSKRV